MVSKKAWTDEEMQMAINGIKPPNRTRAALNGMRMKLKRIGMILIKMR